MTLKKSAYKQSVGSVCVCVFCHSYQTRASEDKDICNQSQSNSEGWDLEGQEALKSMRIAFSVSIFLLLFPAFSPHSVHTIVMERNDAQGFRGQWLQNGGGLTALQ